MSFARITESVTEAANKIIELLNAHLEYYQIVAFDKMVMLLSKTVSSAILGITGFMMAFFGSFALATFLGEIFAHPFIGYIIVMILYGVGGWILWSNRVKWIINPMIGALSELVEETTHDLGLDDEEQNGDDLEEIFVKEE